jgi:type IV/VI secretion system ImpK/VasF family protein
VVATKYGVLLERLDSFVKNVMWSAIQEIFQELDKMIARAQSVVSLKPSGGEERGGLRVLKRGMQGEEVVSLRADIRNKLNFIKAKLSEHLTERETYLVLFPLTVYFDEIVQLKIFQGQHLSWPPLQKELFQIDNGGEVFYDTADDLLRKPETLPFIYEVFYFCLSDGFRGKYAGNPLKITEYQNKLCAKIPLPPVEVQQKEAEAPEMARSEMFTMWHYVAILLFMAGVYAALYVWTSL